MGWDGNIGKGLGKAIAIGIEWEGIRRSNPKQEILVCSIETCSESIQQTMGIWYADTSEYPPLGSPHGNWFPVLELSRITDGRCPTPSLKKRRGGILFLGVTLRMRRRPHTYYSRFIYSEKWYLLPWAWKSKSGITWACESKPPVPVSPFFVGHDHADKRC